MTIQFTKALLMKKRIMSGGDLLLTERTHGIVTTESTSSDGIECLLALLVGLVIISSIVVVLFAKSRRSGDDKL
jgi:hypothetical protein